MSGRSGPPPHVLAPLTKWASGKVATQFLSVLQSEAEAAEAAARLPPGRPQPLWLATRPPPPVLRAPEFLLPDDLSAALLTQVGCWGCTGAWVALQRGDRHGDCWLGGHACVAALPSRALPSPTHYTPQHLTSNCPNRRATHRWRPSLPMAPSSRSCCGQVRATSSICGTPAPLALYQVT